MRKNLIIRLYRTGKSDQKSYNIVLVEKGRRSGVRFLELLGFYSPMFGERLVFIDLRRVACLLSSGVCLQGKASVFVSVLCFYSVWNVSMF